MPSPPLEHFYNLSRLSNAGDQVIVSAGKPEEFRRLAEWFAVESVEKFEGTVSLQKLADSRYGYDAVLVCDLTQPSVVSLEPVRTHIEERFTRELHVAPRARRAVEPAEDPPVAFGDDEGPEELDSPNYDLAVPLLEELSLALDPYPKAPDEVFAEPAGPAADIDSPFAILKKLKDGG